MTASRVLDPGDRIAEVLFGLIMVLTFTGSLSIAEAGQEDVRAMLIGALGCNVAWGLIDGVFYLMGSLAERSRDLKTRHAVRQRVLALPDPPDHVRLTASDWRGALGVFLLVFLSTLPVAVPFMVMDSAIGALRVSNGVAIAMLFAAGVAYGRLVGWAPWMFGISMVVLGAVLVALTIALGG